MPHIAIYLRVSSKRQDLRSQKPDLERWAAAQDQPVKWYTDKFTGKTMDRPGWKALEADLQAGKVSALVVWRLDRLGRTAKGLTALFDDLIRRQDQPGEPEGRPGPSRHPPAACWPTCSRPSHNSRPKSASSASLPARPSPGPPARSWAVASPAAGFASRSRRKRRSGTFTVKASRSPRLPASSASAGRPSTRRSDRDGAQQGWSQGPTEGPCRAIQFQFGRRVVLIFRPKPASFSLPYCPIVRWLRQRFHWFGRLVSVSRLWHVHQRPAVGRVPERSTHAGRRTSSAELRRSTVAGPRRHFRQRRRSSRTIAGNRCQGRPLIVGTEHDREPIRFGARAMASAF